MASIEQKRKHYFESDLSKSNPDEIHMGLAKVDNPSNYSETPRSRSCLLKRELDEKKISYISYTSRLFLKQVSWLCQSKAAINSHKNNGQPQHIRSPAPQGLTFPPPLENRKQPVLMFLKQTVLYKCHYLLRKTYRTNTYWILLMLFSTLLEEEQILQQKAHYEASTV